MRLGLGEEGIRMTWVDGLARQCVLARKEYVPGKPVEEVKRELGLDDVIKLASNENPLGTSPKALEAMIAELRENANRYPDSLCFDLAQKLAEIHGLSPDEIFIDNGLDGVITMLGLTFLNPGDEVIFGSVTFPAYENIATKMGATCVVVPLTADYRLDVDGFVKAITPRTKLIFLCNPNNPTGTFSTKPEFEKLLAATPAGALLVIDEAYWDFADDPAYPQTRPYLGRHRNLIVLRTFSKIAGLGGLRIGYAMADKDIVTVMRKAREPFPVNRIGQVGALAFLSDPDFARKTIEMNRAGRDFYYRVLGELGLKFCRTQTNFVFVDFGRPAAPLVDLMLRDGVIVRPLGFVGFPNAFRISIGLESENLRAAASLKRALGRV
jgi:histidinol-phosphate aminotransferase